MGCDIHMNYEVRNGKGWKLYDWKEKYLIGKYEDGEPKYDYDRMFKDPLYLGRSYNLFAILANVRNGYGFAGCNTGEAFKPIAEPRGLPPDVTKDVKKAADDWGCDGHSHSWLTLAEAMDYDYEQKRYSSGVVGPAEFAHFVENGKPSSWAGAVMGRNVVNVETNTMLKYHTQGYPRDGKNYYTRVEWEESYRSAIGKWWFTAMQTLADMFGKDNVRLVFWFDN